VATTIASKPTTMTVTQTTPQLSQTQPNRELQLNVAITTAIVVATTLANHLTQTKPIQLHHYKPS